MSIHDSYRRCYHDPFKEYIGGLEGEDWTRYRRNVEAFEKDFNNRLSTRLLKLAFNVIGALFFGALFWGFVLYVVFCSAP
ncbi:MAG: hypothetical protein IJT02_02940 [Synergistaceae bacterium]|nr:hypothetical protein [Synergistaceae bacterium]